ncbi:unnamed protein product [Prunus armeniaca]
MTNSEVSDSKKARRRPCARKLIELTARPLPTRWNELRRRSGNFKEFAIIFTKEYTSYKTVRKHADHLFNLRKKLDESLRDYLRRFKAEKANIIGCNDQVASSAFKKGLPTEHELYRELAITPSQTLAEVFATAERYALWDDDSIAAKKASKQVDHPTK